MKTKYVFCLCCALVIAGNSNAQFSVLTKDYNLSRTSWDSSEQILNQSNVTGNFGKIFSLPVDDQVYAQPLILGNFSIAGGTHNVIIICTVNNSVYAYNADTLNTLPYWQVNLTAHYYDDSASYFRPVKPTDIRCTGDGIYTNFNSKIGIVGTPVIDTASQTMYVVARSITTQGRNFMHYLHALDINTGAEKFGGPVLIQGSVAGTGDASVNGIVAFDPSQHNQRPGLCLYNGTVYICWGSQCDNDPYHGWVMGYDAASLLQKFIYCDTPNGKEGGIWMSGSAPAVDSAGFVYITSGDGSAGVAKNANDISNRGESIIKFAPDSTQLNVVDFFTPHDFKTLNKQNLDYGVDGPMLLPNTNFSLSGSKQSFLYLINNSNMGRVKNNDAGVLQKIDINAENANKDKHIHGTPAYFKDNNGNEYIYVWAEEASLKQIPFNRSTMRFDTLNEKTGYTALGGGMPGGVMTVSSNGNDPSSAVVWAYHHISKGAKNTQQSATGILQAFDANDVSHELWNSNWNSNRDSIGTYAKYMSPTVANGKVYIATFSHTVNVYGLNPPPPSSCTATLPSPWQSADIGYDIYPGDVCYNNNQFTVTSSGTDIWYNGDAFHYLYQPLTSGSGQVIARVNSIYNNQFAKCGIMIRANLDPGSPYAFIQLSHANGAVFQSRTVQNGTATASDNNGTCNAPTWLKIAFNGNQYTGYTSADSVNWVAVDSVTVALGTFPYAGIAFTAHTNLKTGNAVVDNISFQNATPRANINFTALNIDNSLTKLNWPKQDEMNAGSYAVERSTSSTNFSEIGRVTLSKSATKEYSFDDVNPANGMNFYRLKKIMKNGSVQYSAIARVNFNLNILNVFPNPTKGELFFENNSKYTFNSKINIILVNEMGQTVYRQTTEAGSGNTFSINIPSKVANGLYVLQLINTKGQKQSDKIILQR